ncbi:MAG: MogA/MoaB family molybdenum cofactor biosynthesis protein [Cellulomonas sp.]|jgi:molybdenum cofactor synthesis domain-containing protein|nr:MogA/MoaB family molybdenum cofactor biosynthesis protein [Cellulomonas sp.]
MTLQGRVVTVSDRVAAGARDDGTGPLLVAWLAGLGLDVTEPTVVPDVVTTVRAAVRQHLAAGARFVVTTGGTGIGPRDRTPEALAPLFDLVLPGVAEAVRAAGAANPTACLSRTVAGVVGHSLVVALPGSPGACEDAMRVLTPVVAHALDQIDGGDHP